MMTYRKATQRDIPTIAEIRKRQLVDEGISPSVNMDAELIEYFTKTMADGTLIEWVAEESDSIIATAAVIFYEFPPCFTNKSGKKAYIANVYTAPEFRCKGIATALLEKVINEAKERNIYHLWLEASTLGRPVYEKLGFVENKKWLEYHLPE